MEINDIVKVKISGNNYIIGVVRDYNESRICFSAFFYDNKLRISRASVIGGEIVDISPSEIVYFKTKLLSEGYSYDDETKTVIHEL